MKSCHSFVRFLILRSNVCTVLVTDLQPTQAIAVLEPIRKTLVENLDSPYPVRISTIFGVRKLEWWNSCINVFRLSA